VALKTTNAGTLVSGVPAQSGNLVRVRLLIATHVHGIGDCEKDDVVDVQPHDAQYLVGYKFAELVDVR
jgi:hypothetical protein